MQLPFTPPAFNATSFNCPHCHCYAVQKWGQGFREIVNTRQRFSTYTPVTLAHFAECSHCNKPSIWVGKRLVWPESSMAPHPNEDLAKEIKDDFNEARAIIGHSPRGAAALLRLCLQKLCKQLGEPGKNINDDIKSLVSKGLNPGIQKALDVVRVVGNAAVHPGEIDLRDKPEYAVQLCEIVNFIANAMITQQKQIDELFGNLPESQLKAIERRDQTQAPQ